MQILEAAQRMIDKGCYIFPVDHPDLMICAGLRETRPGRALHIPEECDQRGKHPTCAFSTIASKELTTTTFNNPNQPRNYGIYTPSSDVVVLDEDEVGRLKAFCENHGIALPHTFTVTTHNGRKHYYFKCPAETFIPNSDLCEGVNVRASSKGYVVGPESKHASGEIYTPEDWDAPFADLPAALLEILTTKDKLTSNADVAAFEELNNEDLASFKGFIQATLKHARTLEDKSAAFYYVITELKDRGLSQAKVGWVVNLWAEKDGWTRYSGRMEAEVARVWNKTPDYKSKEKKSPANSAITSAVDYDVKPIFWVYEERIPKSELTLFAGDGGIGKSTIATRLCADITLGQLAGDLFGTERNIIYISSEEDWSTAIKPRLVAAGANIERCFNVERVSELDIRMPLSLPEDQDILEGAIEALDPALIVIDALTSFINSKASENSNKEVRAVLEPLVRLCHQYGVAVLGIAHLNKNSGVTAGHRIMGSSALRNLPRSVLMAVGDMETGVNYFGQNKSSYGQLSGTTMYEIQSEEQWVRGFNKPLTTAKVVFTGYDGRNIDLVLLDLHKKQTAEKRTGRPPEAVDAATHQIIHYLRTCEGRRASKEDIIRVVENHGGSKRTAERALNDPRFIKEKRERRGKQFYRLEGEKEVDLERELNMIDGEDINDLF